MDILEQVLDQIWLSCKEDELLFFLERDVHEQVFALWLGTDRRLGHAAPRA
jgi:hypothetical protein